ncbi:hypothetical protein A1O3_06684 [Capronia epimyces CBS 606.96]|uniref:Uncharacterized protein n=1 Tax=Capronia epimyces CBS 606.96 TaxID=1182542 RepID=W9YKU4_9EURO|nr:uncharacterized protein A1O3_06684 [Capronia epimyces CBS 606.96]EXJ82869.1 hypothetical protein A1O3_06684 [Capronia epimyces CBS 606.96]
MASTSSSTMSSSSGDESVNGGPAGNNGTRGSFGAETAANDVAGTSVFPNGDYLNRVLSRLSARQHDVSSGRTSRNSGDTAATSFDEVLASRVGPIAYHPVGSPNPLRAPQPSLASVLSRQTSPSTEETPLPAIAAVKIDTFTTTSFGQNPKFSATAHAIFNVTAVPQNACMADESDASSNLPLPPYRLMDNYPGYLTDLEFQTFISGPGTKLVEMGPPTRESLHLGDSWVTVVHLGVKETSLASRLSISVRSKGNSSAARSMEKSASMSLIDQWLDVLKMDNRKKNEPVVVTAVIKYRHAFMPADTWLKTRTSCTPDMTGKNIAEAEIRTARKGKAKAHDSADPPPYMVLNGDPLQRTLLAGMVVRVLDPGDDSLRLHSLRGVVGPSQPAVRAVDALRLLQEVRESFGYGHDHLINIDLVALQNYYQDTLTKETHTTEATAIARSVRRHAQTMVKKLSPQKLAKKPSVSCVPTPSTAASAAPAPTAPTAPTASVTASAAPQVARNEPREDVAGHESGTGVGSGSASGRAVVRQRTIWEEGEDFYAQIIEGQPGTPRPDLPL